MSNCKYCGKGFSCGCQKTTASDGAIVHKTCKEKYEKNDFQPANTTSSGLTQLINKAQNNINR
jgi:hypothetical protein